MILARLFRSLPATASRHEATFQRARAASPVLAQYPTATALLEALDIDASLPLERRQELVLAVAALHRTARHPLWQALLVQAFRQMLRGMRRRKVGPAEDREERVLLAFLQALETVRLEGQPVFLAVRRATARALVQAAHAQGDDGETVPLETVARACARPHADPGPFVACLAREVAAQLGDAGSRGVDMVRVLAGVETIREQVARSASTSDARGVSLAALRKRRQRAVSALRTAVGDQLTARA